MGVQVIELLLFMISPYKNRQLFLLNTNEIISTLREHNIKMSLITTPHKANSLYFMIGTTLPTFLMTPTTTIMTTIMATMMIMMMMIMMMMTMMMIMMMMTMMMMTSWLLQPHHHRRHPVEPALSVTHHHQPLPPHPRLMRQFRKTHREGGEIFC